MQIKGIMKRSLLIRFLETLHLNVIFGLCIPLWNPGMITLHHFRPQAWGSQQHWDELKLPSSWGCAFASGSLLLEAESRKGGLTTSRKGGSAVSMPLCTSTTAWPSWAFFKGCADALGWVMSRKVNAVSHKWNMRCWQNYFSDCVHTLLWLFWSSGAALGACPHHADTLWVCWLPSKALRRAVLQVLTSPIGIVHTEHSWWSNGKGRRRQNFGSWSAEWPLHHPSSIISRANTREGNAKRCETLLVLQSFTANRVC